MNKHILFVMRSLDNPELFTQAEKEVNRISASYAAAYVDDDSDADAYVADAAADAAYATTASAASYASAAAYAADVGYWVNEFFGRSGEDKQTYINEVERSGEDKQTYINEVERLKEDKTMDKHILFVMRSLDNPELFTRKEKEANKNSAAAAYIAADTAAADAAAYVAVAADYIAAAAAYIAAAAADAKYWVNKFFGRSGEDKQTYIDEVERLKEDNNMHYDEQREEAMQQQVGGTHYKDLGVQPLELTLKNMGFLAFEGACYTKINKYMIRNKDNKVEQLKKAQHVLSMWIEEAEKQQ